MYSPSAYAPPGVSSDRPPRTAAPKPATPARARAKWSRTQCHQKCLALRRYPKPSEKSPVLSSSKDPDISSIHLVGNTSTKPARRTVARSQPSWRLCEAASTPRAPTMCCSLAAWMEKSGSGMQNEESLWERDRPSTWKARCWSAVCRLPRMAHRRTSASFPRRAPSPPTVPAAASFCAGWRRTPRWYIVSRCCQDVHKFYRQGGVGG
mmetsp:Transcript_12162/g.26791  ORF Transcript_12162/g.26791 Transcript_12162/m.26791 type:complete len:208 (-) Transcript_12162:20-643(-)